VNIAYYLLPKHCVTYLYDDQSFRQGLEKMRYHGYTAIPVITRKGRYVGTISEGDFLWQLFPEGTSSCPCSRKELEKRCIRDLLRKDHYPPVRITATMEELVTSAMNQNFIPVVDDLGSFIGIITRRDIIRNLSERTNTTSGALRKIV
jgi:CBS domain-containing protein